MYIGSKIFINDMLYNASFLMNFLHSGASPISGGTLGQGYGSIWMTETNCSLDTPNLLSCNYDANTQSCTHSDDAGAMCLPAGKYH